MRKLISSLFILLISISSCKEKREDILNDIKEDREKIDKKLDNYSVKRIDDLAFKGTGTITGYFDGKDIKKIYSERFGETKRSFTNYYFDDGMLIYALKQDYIYNMPNTYTEEKAKEHNDTVWYDDKKTRLEISKYYFDDNKLIKWVNADGANVPANTPDYVSKESDMWSEAIILLKQLKEQ